MLLRSSLQQIPFVPICRPLRGEPIVYSVLTAAKFSQMEGPVADVLAYPAVTFGAIKVRLPVGVNGLKKSTSGDDVEMIVLAGRSHANEHREIQVSDILGLLSNQSTRELKRVELGPAGLDTQVNGASVFQRKNIEIRYVLDICVDVARDPTPA